MPFLFGAAFFCAAWRQYFCRMQMPNAPDPQILIDLTQTKMPFGKYKDRVLRELPVSYLEWFARKGFPPGKLGVRLQTLYEIKINGLEALLDGPLR